VYNNIIRVEHAIIMLFFFFFFFLFNLEQLFRNFILI